MKYNAISTKCSERKIYLIPNRQRVKMSDTSKKTKKNSNSQQPKDLGQQVTDEWNKFAKNIPDVKKEIEDVINSVGEKKEGIVEKIKEARDKLVELYQESKNHSHVLLLGVILGGSVIILSFGIIKMIC